MPTEKPVVAAGGLHSAEAAIEELAVHGFGLALGADPDDDESWAGVADFVRRAHDSGVGVVLGPVVRGATGEPDFFSVATVEPACASLLAVCRRVLAEGLPVEWLFLDAEPSKAWMRDFMSRLREGGVPASLYWAASKTDVGAVEDARRRAAEAVTTAAELGFSVGVTTVPFVLDDADRGGRAIEDAMGLPVSDVPWSTISFQLYRSLFNGSDAGLAFGIPAGSFSPYFVYSYASSAVRRYGDRAAAGLGVAGKPAPVVGMGSGFYEDASELAADVSAAKAAGIKRLSQLHLFWLDGMIEGGALDAWLETVDASACRFEPDEATKNLRKLMAATGEMLERQITSH